MMDSQFMSEMLNYISNMYKDAAQMEQDGCFSSAAGKRADADELADIVMRAYGRSGRSEGQKG